MSICDRCLATSCICTRPGAVEIVCERCGERRSVVEESAADRWAQEHRCRRYRHVGWTPEKDAAVVAAAGENGGPKRLAERLGIPYTAVSKRVETLRKRGAQIKPRPPRGRVWTAAEDDLILEAVRLNYVLGFLPTNGGRFGALAVRLGLPVAKIRARSYKIGAKRKVLDELKKPGEG